MFELFVREGLGGFGFPPFYVDYAEGRLPNSLNDPRLFGEKEKKEFGRGSSASVRRPFWNEVLDYNARLGASEASLRAIEDLRDGRALPIVTGQQAGLFGGPLYTLYKALTAISLAGAVSGQTANRAQDGVAGGRRTVPVFWNASDDSDFAEVDSAVFFGKDLLLKKLAVSASNHVPGNMVGSTSPEALNAPIEILMEDFGEQKGTPFVLSLVEDSLAPARDWGEFFSSLILHLLASSGLVVVDARMGSVAEHSKDVMSSYLKKAGEVQVRISERLEEMRKRGYAGPVSPLAGESCVFVRKGETRTKVLKEELPGIADLWHKNAVELLPNVLFGPVVRDVLMAPVANVVGPSEVSYYSVGRALYEVLELEQRPVFPRMSLTIVPGDLTFLVKDDPALFKGLVLSFDSIARSFVESRIPAEVTEELETSGREMHAILERLRRLAEGSGMSTAEVVASAAKKMDFELSRIGQGLTASYRKKIVNERPMLRAAGDFLLPGGGLQERSLCCLAPLIYGGESLLLDLAKMAAMSVEEVFAGRINHYIVSTGIP